MTEILVTVIFGCSTKSVILTIAVATGNFESIACDHSIPHSPQCASPVQKAIAFSNCDKIEQQGIRPPNGFWRSV
jgi:hypothetical protein